MPMLIAPKTQQNECDAVRVIIMFIQVLSSVFFSPLRCLNNKMDLLFCWCVEAGINKRNKAKKNCRISKRKELDARKMCKESGGGGGGDATTTMGRI